MKVNPTGHMMHDGHTYALFFLGLGPLFNGTKRFSVVFLQGGEIIGTQNWLKYLRKWDYTQYT